jgi:hypothetical protein
MSELIDRLRTRTGVESDGLWWAIYKKSGQSWSTTGHPTKREAVAFLRAWMRESGGKGMPPLREPRNS